MPSNNPKVTSKIEFSIITITLNAKKDLEKTIESLKKQKFKNFEHIIIDGNSTDGTKNIIKKKINKNMRFFSSKDKGIYDAMNKGLKKVKGRYIGILNAGDTYLPNGLKIINKYFYNNHKIDFVFGTVMKKKLKFGYKKYRILWNFDFYPSHSSGFFIKTSSQNKIGYYKLKYKISSDYDLFYRMIVKKKMKGVSTKKEELIGTFKSGTSYSSKFSYFDHLKEETLIRIDNQQNKFFVFLIYLNHFLKNKSKINAENKITFFFKKFFEIYSRRKIKYSINS